MDYGQARKQASAFSLPLADSHDSKRLKRIKKACRDGYQGGMIDCPAQHTEFPLGSQGKFDCAIALY